MPGMSAGRARGSGRVGPNGWLACRILVQAARRVEADPMTATWQRQQGLRLPLGAAVVLLGAGLGAAGLLGLSDPTLPIGVSIVATTPLVLVAAHRLAGPAERWVAALADALAVTLVAGLPRWWPHGSQGPHVRPPPEQALHLAGLLAVLLMMFVITQTLTRGRTRAGTRPLLVGGLAALAGYAGLSLWAGAPDRPGPAWALALPVLAGACWTVVAARRPAPAQDDEDREPRSSPARVGLLAVLGGAAPASLLVGSAPVTAQDVVPVMVSCSLLALCSLSHLWWRARRLGIAAQTSAEAADQQRTLVRVGQGLLQARDRTQVARAAAAGAVQVLASGGASRAAAAVAFGPTDLLDLVAVDSIGMDLAETAGLDLDRLSAPDRALLARGQPVLRDIPPTAGAPDRLETLLLLPLRSPHRAHGALLLAGPRVSLSRLRTTLDAYAVQVSLALEAARSAALPVPTPRTDAGTGGTAPPTAGLVAVIAQGLRNGEFRDHYQPVVDMRDGSVVGFEALVRWQHPKRGLLLPAAFLDAVEDAGLLTALDDHLLGDACRDIVLIDPAMSGPYVSVNLSRGQLADPGLVQRVQAALGASGLAPWRLQLEVTETSALERPEQTADTLRRLRVMRVRVAFDDFGTGQSSLSWLHQLPLDVVKLDQSFVGQLPTPPGSPPVVAAMTALSHVLGLGVIAEGVETVEQQQELLSMGVQHAQGWLYAKALPVEQAREFARSRSTAGRGTGLPGSLSSPVR